jgi:hypothetical protein
VSIALQQLFESPEYSPPEGLHFTRALESLHRKARGHPELSPGLSRVIIADRGLGLGVDAQPPRGESRPRQQQQEQQEHEAERASADRWFDAFYSTSGTRRIDPSYHYSRMFGAPYSGAGMGLLKSKVRFLDKF